MLEYTHPYELLIAARLSAQCTDKRVNETTNILFKKYPTIDAFANADLIQLEQDIKSCGFYHEKAKSLIAICSRLINVYNREIPDNIEDLMTLHGIGSKTANLIIGDIFGKPAIVTDTHFIRITNRLGLTQATNPRKVEQDLRALIPPEISSDFCHRTVQFGRDVCKARKPLCEECEMHKDCCYINFNPERAKPTLIDARKCVRVSDLPRP
jgi:endonuclease-3